MKLAKTLLIGAAAALAFGGAYAAAPKASGNEPGFNALDKNNDGYLSRSEAAKDKDVSKNFKAIDKNGDGKISRTEYLEHKGKNDLSSAGNKVKGAWNSMTSKGKGSESSSTGSTAGSTSK